MIGDLVVSAGRIEGGVDHGVKFIIRDFPPVANRSLAGEGAITEK
jgi:hypothetical protein